MYNSGNILKYRLNISSRYSRNHKISNDDLGEERKVSVVF